MVACACNPSTQDVEAGGIMSIYLGQSGLYKKAQQQTNKQASLDYRERLYLKQTTQKSKAKQNRIDILEWSPVVEHLF